MSSLVPRSVMRDPFRCVLRRVGRAGGWVLPTLGYPHGPAPIMFPNYLGGFVVAQLVGGAELIVVAELDDCADGLTWHLSNHVLTQIWA